MQMHLSFYKNVFPAEAEYYFSADLSEKYYFECCSIIVHDNNSCFPMHLEPGWY